MQLGGKNPLIVFGDVDVAKVASECVRSSFTNQGEICLCSSRLYVHRSIFDQFVAAFAVCNSSHMILYRNAQFDCDVGGGQEAHRRRALRSRDQDGPAHQQRALRKGGVLRITLWSVYDRCAFNRSAATSSLPLTMAQISYVAGSTSQSFQRPI